MANPKIKDVKGNEIRVQLSQDKKFVDLFLGPEKTRTFHHSKPKKISWFVAHRLYSATEAQKLLKRLTQVAKQLR